jgi:hypothetical protein
VADIKKYLMLELCDALRHAPSGSITVNATRATMLHAIVSADDVDNKESAPRRKGCSVISVDVEDLGLGSKFPSFVGV